VSKYVAPIVMQLCFETDDFEEHDLFFEDGDYEDDESGDDN